MKTISGRIEVIAVSACLLGIASTYRGDNNLSLHTIEKIKGKIVFPVCPEAMGGLPTPRIPSEIQNDGITVLAKDKTDVTTFFQRGASIALDIAVLNGCHKAIMKENSPSCGSGYVYDGTFSGKLIKGKGYACRIFQKSGIDVENEK